MAADLPRAEMKKLEARLCATVEIQKRVISRSPSFLAIQLGPKSLIPNAWAVLHHACDATQAARFHLYMAMYERLRYREYKKPPEPQGGDMLADFYFTSFALHVVAAEGHIALSLGRLYGMPGAGRNGFKAPTSNEIYGFLRREPGAEEFVTLLAPFQGRDANWKWIKRFRNRWAHMNPVRVKEFGIQYSMDFKRDSFWTTKSNVRSISVGGGDPPETTVPEMLKRGVRAFNLLGKQLDLYTAKLETSLPNG